MAKVTRSPVNGLEALVSHGVASWPTGPAPGDHIVKISISVDYALSKMNQRDISVYATGSKSKNDSKKKRKSSADYKRMYISYSVGGQIEGKTETFAITGSDWSVTHEVNVTNDFLSGLYGKPTEFVIWEIVRTEDREREGVQSLRKNVHNIGLSPSNIHGNYSGINGVNDGVSPMTIAAVAASKNASNGAHGQHHGHGDHGIPKNNPTAHNHRIELFGDKLPMSLAQTGLTKKRHHKQQRELRDDDNLTQSLGVEEIVEVDPNRPRPEAVLKSRLVGEPSTRTARGQNDHIRVGQDMIDSILTRLSRRQSSSTPDLNAALRQGVHEFKAIAKRTNSDSPPLDRFRPGSPLHKFLTDDFGTGGNQDTSGRPTSRASMRETPHPHHYDHPERHVSPDALHRGLVRSRSSSSMASLVQLHPKTPPSPHHHEHPLKILAPRGRVKMAGGAHSDAGTATTNSRGKKSENRKLDTKRNDTSRSTRVGASHDRPRVVTISQDHRHSRTGNRPNAFGVDRDDARHIRWDAESGPGNRTINWTELPFEEAERRANDQTIEAPIEKLLLEKKKGEYTHIPIGKVILDVTGLFFDVLETKASVVHLIDGLDRCDMSVRLDGPLLSHEQAVRLNPMCVTVGVADGMPSQPLSYEELDEKCMPVSVKFRLYADPFINTATLIGVPHTRRMDFNSQHLILAGMMDAERLRDEILKGPLVVEVHDRDHRLPADLAKINAELRDDGTISASMNPINPYGEASFWLNALVHGQTEVFLSAPILPGRAPATKSKRTLPSGLWLESSANLSATINVRFPIGTTRSMKGATGHVASTTAAIHTLAITHQPCYAHVVIIAASRNGSVPKTVHEIVTCCNAETLKIPASSGRADLALATYQLTEEQRKNTSLDILTGYDIFDSRSRVMFIEGIVHGGIQRLLQALDAFKQSPDVHVWHSPTHLFNKPVCSGLTPVVMHVQLEPELMEIMYNTSTYVRGRMTRDCFDCLEIIRQAVDISNVQSESVRTKIFPTQQMILGLIGVFGQMVPFEDSIPVGEFAEVPMERPVLSAMPELSPSAATGMASTAADLVVGGTREGVIPSGVQTNIDQITKSQLLRGSKRLPYGRNGVPVNHPFEYSVKADHGVIDHENRETIERLHLRHLREPNFVRINIKDHKHVKSHPRERNTEHDVYNYSIQALSAAQQQLNDLRNRMSKDKSHHYAYCTEYFSQTVAPIDIETELKREQIDSHKRWKTRKGFWAGPFSEFRSATGVTDMRHDELLQPWVARRSDFGMILREASSKATQKA